MSMTSNEYDVVSRNNPAQYKSTYYVRSVRIFIECIFFRISNYQALIKNIRKI